ncbi:MAG: polysaccharide biosynthesis C-terminal domain-containing protein, partial [Rhizobacter sp.]
LFAPDVLRLMAAPAYWSATRYLPLLVLAAILQVLVYPLQTGIYYQKQSRQIFYVTLMQSVVGIGLGALLIWQWGTLGACIGVLTTVIASLVMTNHISQRYFVVHYKHGKLLILLALAILTACAGYASDNLPLAAALGFKLLLVPAFLAGVAFTHVIEPTEMAIAKAWLSRRFSSSRRVTE